MWSCEPCPDLGHNYTCTTTYCCGKQAQFIKEAPVLLRVVSGTTAPNCLCAEPRIAGWGWRTLVIGNLLCRSTKPRMVNRMISRSSLPGIGRQLTPPTSGHVLNTKDRSEGGAHLGAWTLAYQRAFKRGKPSESTAPWPVLFLKTMPQNLRPHTEIGRAHV